MGKVLAQVVREKNLFDNLVTIHFPEGYEVDVKELIYYDSNKSNRFEICNKVSGLARNGGENGERVYKLIMGLHIHVSKFWLMRDRLVVEPQGANSSIGFCHEHGISEIVKIVARYFGAPPQTSVELTFSTKK